MNEVLKAIAQRSSIRAYTAKKLTDTEIKTLITAGICRKCIFQSLAEITLYF